MVMMLYIWSVLLLNLSILETSLADRRTEGDVTQGRLPTTLWPINYKLEVQPDIYTGAPPFYFNGSVEVSFECYEATSVVYLSNKGLTVPDSSIYLVMAPDSPVPGPDPVWTHRELDEDFEWMKIFLNTDLLEGAVYNMGMTFNGTLATPQDQYGMFWTSYQSIIDGSTVYSVTSQFQSIGARWMFPHFDEVMFKATFDTTLVRQSNVIALSNGNLISSEDRGNGWIADTFNTTVKMSSYLLCLAIGDFDYMETISNRGQPIRVWSRSEYVQDLAFANSVAAGVSEYYEAWTGIPDAMPKLDHIAPPGFNLGAMENWGLIPYGEFWLLYNASTDYLSDQREIVNTIGHEVSHLWFGDLVTNRYWTDVWLHEGFAVYFGNFPFKDVMGIEGNEMHLGAHVRSMLVEDSWNTSVPVRRVANTPMDPSSSTFTYGKGSTVLRMLHQVLGDGTFQRGLQNFLNEFAFSVAETDDLWDALTAQAEIDGVTDTNGFKLLVKEKMDIWINQRGYPLVTFTRTGPSTVDVTQTQFLSPKDQEYPPSPYFYEWHIPVTMANQQNLNWSMHTIDWLNRENKTLSEGLPDSEDQWFLANINQVGFFRVKYDNNTYFQIVNQLDADASVIPPSSRWSILNDAFEISRAGLEPEVHAFEATRFLDQETVFVIWELADRFLQLPANILARFPNTAIQFETYMRSKVDPVYSLLGWINLPEDMNHERSVRARLIWLACSYGNSDCELQARNEFDILVGNPTQNIIPIDHREPVYCTTTRTGTLADWDFLHSQYLAVVDSLLRDTIDEVDRILTSLACSEDVSTIQRYISLTFDPAAIRAKDGYMALDAVAHSGGGRWILWEHFKVNWTNNPVPNGVNKWGLLNSIAEGMASQDDIQELENFISAYPPVDQWETDRYNEARDNAYSNKAWADANEPDLYSWLLAQNGGYLAKNLPSGINVHLRQFKMAVRDVRRMGEKSQWYSRYHGVRQNM